jgi:probable phosphomutase (TIGR03848 family)
MGTLILLRHGRSSANGAHVLAGRTPGIGLDPTGLAQAEHLVQRLADCRLTAIVSSPMDRCRATVEPLSLARRLPVTLDDRLTEVDYGDWTGRSLDDLRKEPAWRTVQDHPSAMVFPGGEGLAAVSARAVAAAREHAAASDGAVLLCSHGDVLGAIVADALGLHLDLFQRIILVPSSVSVVRYTPTRSFVERFGDTGTLAGIGVAPTSHDDAPAIGGDPGTPGTPDAQGRPGDAGDPGTRGDAGITGEPGIELP